MLVAVQTPLRRVSVRPDFDVIPGWRAIHPNSSQPLRTSRQRGTRHRPGPPQRLSVTSGDTDPRPEQSRPTTSHLTASRSDRVGCLRHPYRSRHSHMLQRRGMRCQSRTPTLDWRLPADLTQRGEPVVPSRFLQRGSRSTPASSPTCFVGSDCGECTQTGTGKCGERYRGVIAGVQPIQRSGAGAPGPSQEGLDDPPLVPSRCRGRSQRIRRFRRLRTRWLPDSPPRRWPGLARSREPLQSSNSLRKVSRWRRRPPR